MYDKQRKEVVNEFELLVSVRRYAEAFALYKRVIWNTMYWNQGRGPKVLELLKMLYVNGIDQLPDLPTDADKASAENLAGILLSEFGDSRSAVQKFENYINLSSSMPSRAQGLLNKGDDLWRLGKIVEAAAAFDQAIQIYRQLHLPGKLALAFTDKARVCIWISDHEGATKYLEKARELLRISGDFVSLSQQVLLEGKINDYTVNLLLFKREFRCAEGMAEDWASRVKHAEGASFDTQTSAFLWALNTKLRLLELEGRNLAKSQLALEIRDSLLECFFRSLKNCARYQQAVIRLAAARYLKLMGKRAKASREALLSLEISRPSAWVYLQADSHLFLASLHIDLGNIDVASGHAIRARESSRCDGSEYCYKPAKEEAEALIRTLAGKKHKKCHKYS